jgi:DNA polymerase I-like protein with 3'-5' exonuclease and polymerase domains
MYLATIDYETEAIGDRPDAYPPKPVGVAIKARGRVKYWAWGHPTGNNCTVDDVRPILLDHHKNARCIFHNCAFDIEVGTKWLDLPFPNVYDDTEFLAFLNDPREPSLALKKLAEVHLDMPPDEQDELSNWILDNVTWTDPNSGKVIKASRAPTKWGAHIAKAPGDLVGKYARGDVVRTEKLYKLFRPIVADRMDEAYERELRLVKTKLSMEQRGVQTRHKAIKRDYPKYLKAWKDVANAIRRKLKITKADDAAAPNGVFNVNSNDQLADALDRAGLITDWAYTDKGNRSVSVENLKQTCNDKRFIKLYTTYSILETYVNRYLTPWLDTGDYTGGRIYPTFNQVRTNQEHGDFKSYGTKTGRPSVSNPNFNNLPANIYKSKNRDALLTLKDYLAKYGVNFVGLRDYIGPSPGNYLVGRDYAQQELRVLAHYENGALMRAFQNDPFFDVHTHMIGEIYNQFGVTLTREQVKAIAFGLIYGLGLTGLADKLETTYAEAKKLKQAYLSFIPGVKDLDSQLREYADNDWAIHTLAGRAYKCEPDKIINGEYRSFEYRMINLLIQGTSADITKDAMDRIDQALPDTIIIQLYDEIIGDTPDHKRAMEVMRDEMERPVLDVPLPTDAEFSKFSWARMRDYKDPKK